ncbi:MAG: response regulator [Xanthobacteraceae bacterium]
MTESTIAITESIDLNRSECVAPDPDADKLLIVDHDVAVLQCLASALQKRGFEVIAAQSVAEATIHIHSSAPALAVVGMRFDDGCGLDVVAALKQRRPDARAVVQTSYGSLATVVGAVKAGAVDYLIKPADPDDIVSALSAPAGGKAVPPHHPLSADRARWEHIRNIYEQCGRNVSETARRLAMHRRTLQRILAKRAPR